MSAATANLGAPSAAPTGPAQGDAVGRGGRGRGRARRSERGSRGGQSSGSRDGRRGWGGGQRNRNGSAQDPQSSSQKAENILQPAAFKPPPVDHGGGGTSGEHPTGDAKITEGAGIGGVEGEGIRPEQVAEDGIEAEVCFICASDIAHQSVASCNHRTCHICSLRMRALYKSRACPHCRTEAKLVIFTDNAEKRYEDFVDSDFVHTDDILGIRYERKEIQDDTTLLLRYNCPEETCDIACYGWPDLHRHVKSVHHKQLCDLCTRNKKVFTHEHELFTRDELRRHERHGDHFPGQVDQTGFKGHPECGFCRERFYGDDELYAHCRDKHEKCYLCERMRPGVQQQYYINYDALEVHFRKDHFMCADQECLEKKFVVFGSEMDLKAHQLEAHPHGLSKDARRDARLVDISAFDYRQPYDERTERGGRRGRGGGGRGRDPNTEALPPSSAQPLRRDQVAFQRQMQIQSAQSITTRTFQGGLSSVDTPAARPNNRHQQAPETVSVPRTAQAPAADLPMQNLSLETPHTNTNNSQAALTPHEQARQIQHNAVLDRAALMLRNDPSKVSTFRSRVSSYRLGAITASQAVDAFLALFDIPAAELGKIVKELADLYENEAKRVDLLKAWNDWRAINEDYPTLPGPIGALPSANTSTAGRRILKLKSSTAQSSRAVPSSGQQPRTWGALASSNASTRNGPALSANRVGAGRVGPTPWAGARAGVSPARTPAPSTTPSRPGTASSNVRGTAVGNDAFPSLPVAPIMQTHMMGLHRGAVRWDDRAPVTANAWSVGGGSLSGAASSGTGAGVSEADGLEDDGAGTTKKKGKKAKQTLYKFG